ncbi:hypothetical protein [Streptomyces sp. NPDC005017]|uniref:hypothetical protein n=1 Tax=Streptomyces sp. NPDC005017 TaxID=3364706 RepID=UPI00368C599C
MSAARKDLWRSCLIMPVAEPSTVRHTTTISQIDGRSRSRASRGRSWKRNGTAHITAAAAGTA